MELKQWLNEIILKPHNSAITGNVMCDIRGWYGIPVRCQLAILGAETSLGDPELGGSLALQHNYGCLKWSDQRTKWSILANGKVDIRGKWWFTFPDVYTGMVAWGRYIKLGPMVNGEYTQRYLPILNQRYGWHRPFANIYYGVGVPKLEDYIWDLRTIEDRMIRSAKQYHAILD